MCDRQRYVAWFWQRYLARQASRRRSCSERVSHLAIRSGTSLIVRYWGGSVSVGGLGWFPPDIGTRGLAASC
jgi:hypothetical protein